MRRWIRNASMPTLINLITLLATVVVAAVVLVYVLALSRGSGGDFWGFEPHLSAADAASTSLAAGDYRFLAFQLTGPGGNVEGGWPNASECAGHPLGAGLHLRMNHIDQPGNPNAARAAHAFASAYNARVHLALEMRHGAECLGTVQRP